MTCELVEQDRDAVDAADALEVRLDLLRAGPVVDVADEDAPRVDVFLALAHLVTLVIDRLLHLPQLLRLIFHLLHTALHRRDLFLWRIVSLLLLLLLLLLLERMRNSCAAKLHSHLELCLLRATVQSVERTPYLLVVVFGRVKALVLLALLFNLGVGHVCGVTVVSVSAH
jgi:hypothetical protein